MDQAAIWTLWGPLLTIAIIFAVRFRRAGRERRLRPWTLWGIPLLVVVGLALLLWQLRPPPLGWAALAGGSLLGALLGWHRGKLVQLRLEPATGFVFQRVSPLAVLLLLGIVALRFLVQQEYGAAPPGQPATMAAIMVSDALIGLAAFTILFTRLEISLRVRAMAAEGGVNVG